MTYCDANNPIRKRVDDVSFSTRRGEILGVARLIGVGRIELMQAVFGVYEGASEVGLILDRKPPKARMPLDAIRADIAMAPEDHKRRGIVSLMNVGHNITLIVLQHFARLGYIDGAAELDAICKEMRRLAMRVAHPMLPIASLSGDNQQKAVLTRMLLTEPRVLILNEPTCGVDVGVKYEVYKLIGDLTKRGIAVIVIPSELSEVLDISDRVLVIGEGQLHDDFMNDGLTQEHILTVAIQPVQNPPRHAATFH